MSYISKALKKAELDKQGSRPPHWNIVTDAKLVDKPITAGRNRIIGFFIITALFAVLVLSIMAWSFKAAYRENVEKSVSIEKSEPKQAVPSSVLISQYYSEALQKQRSGDYEGAEISYNKVLAMEPNHIFALNNLGVIFMVHSKDDEALELFYRAITLKNDYADPYYNIACIHAKANRIAESLRYLNSAVSIKPEVIKWAMEDSDLINIRKTVEFKRLIGK